MTRDVVFISTVICALLLPLVLCGTMKNDDNRNVNGLEEDSEAELLAKLMNAKREDNQPYRMMDDTFPEDAPERNMPTAKDTAEDYAAAYKQIRELRRGHCHIWC